MDQGTYKWQLHSSMCVLRFGIMYSLRLVHMFWNMLEKLI